MKEKNKKEDSLYPIGYKGKWLEEEECDSVFTAFYHSRFSLNDESGVYLSEGHWIYPDGHIDEW